MAERRALVIGSQCDALSPLSFLPETAQRLHIVLLDPELGACTAAIGSGLLLDPSVDVAKDALRRAFESASADDATLLLAFIGHGEVIEDDFYLLPKDARYPPNTDRALNLALEIKELLRDYSVDGVVVLVDTCYSGSGAQSAAQLWTRVAYDFRFDFLAAAGERPAFDGCFTKTLDALLRAGMASGSAELDCRQVVPALQQACPLQTPTLISKDSSGLFIAFNRAQHGTDDPVGRAPISGSIEQLTAIFQPTSALAALVALSSRERAVVVVGAPGVGKSALVSALVRPEVAGGAVPQGFVQAFVGLSEASSPDVVANQLREQLAGQVDGYDELVGRFEQLTSDEQLDTLDALHREVLGPLRLRDDDAHVRIVLDGLDQLSDVAIGSVRVALEEMASEDGYDGVHTIVTTRPEPIISANFTTFVVDDVSEADGLAYLEKRDVPERLRARVGELAAGNWLTISLLADLVNESPDDIELSTGWIWIYDHLLAALGADDDQKWRDEFSPVISALAVAGVGPSLPLQLLCSASAKLGGPARRSSVRDVLAQLHRLVVRGRPGTDSEQAGLFHVTLRDYLLGRSGRFRIDSGSAHEAALDAIAELAPQGKFDYEESLQLYAAALEPEHLWAIGRTNEIIKSLEGRASLIPAENLERWQRWQVRFANAFGSDRPDTLIARRHVARWTGEAGDPGQALRLFRALLPDCERILGSDDLQTLSARSHLAYLTGNIGDLTGSLGLLRDLYPDCERLLGRDHPLTLIVGGQIAEMTAATGDHAEAVRLYGLLLPDQERVLGHDHPSTLAARTIIATMIGLEGDHAEALRQSRALLVDHERVLGRDHPQTLGARSNVARFTGMTGRPADALRLLRPLLVDHERVLGRDHSLTLTVRSLFAQMTAETGDHDEAFRLFRELLPDQERVFGRDHLITLAARRKLAGSTSNLDEALRMFRDLLPDHQRILGVDHPDTLLVRQSVANLTGEPAEALRLLHDLYLDYERLLGRDHPRTLVVGGQIAEMTAATGDHAEAVRLYGLLLPDQERVLGRDHPAVVPTRFWVAVSTQQSGDTAGALQQFRALLPDLERVFGPEDPKTLWVRDLVARSNR
jgi:tetratricopeptide (TPR) repeat protein